MAWIQIEKRKWAGFTMPNNIIRLRRNGLTVSPNIGEKFLSGRATLADGRETVRFGISFDPETKSIKLDPTSVNGFSFSTGPSTGSKTLSVSHSAGMRKVMSEGTLPVGDYQLTDEANLVFKLAE